MSVGVAARRPGSRPAAGRLLRTQLGHEVAGLWRTTVVVIISFGLPLVWLLVVGAIAGNALVPGTGGLRIMQFVTPVAMSMGVLYATYPTMAIGLAEARDTGVLKRLRGTPLPAWIHLTGRIGAAVVFAMASVAASLGVAVGAFDVRIVWRTVPATVATLVLGIAAFAAIGLAVATLSPSQTFAQAVSVGTAVALTFVSGLFSFGERMPAWLERLGDALPLRPLNVSLQEQFNPLHPGTGWSWDRMAVVAAWGLAAGLVAARFFRWDSLAAGRGGAASPVVASRAVPALTPTQRRRRPPALVLDQAGAAARTAWRDAACVFFAVVMPLGLYVLITTTQGRGQVLAGGVPFEVWYAAGMATWGTAVAVFVDIPEFVARARDRGVLKRLRGTPLRPWQYLAGQTLTGLGIAGLVTAVVLGTGAVFFDVPLSLPGVLYGAGVLVVGTLALTACGFALAAVVGSARAVGAVALAVLMALGFFSNIFVAGIPDWMQAVGSWFPLLHLQHGLMQAWDPRGASPAWGDLAVLALWGLVATAFAVRFFRWERRAG